MKRILAAAFVALSLPAGASEPAKRPEREKTPPVFRMALRPGLKADEFAKSASEAVRRMDPADEGIDELAIVRLRSELAARMRAEQVQRILGADLKNQGKVALGDLRAFLDRELPKVQPQNRTAAAAQMERFFAAAAALDSDKNGVIDFDEMRTLPPEAFVVIDRRIAADMIRPLFSLSPRKEGKVKAGDIETAARELFAALDTDGDGVLTESEIGDLRMGQPRPAAPKPPQPENGKGPVR